jgi:hypothetical protein
MLSRAAVASISAAAILGLTAESAAAPAATALIRPGVSIGKVRLGMRFADVRRALGRPMLVNRRQNRGFGRIYVEYAWEYGAWRVGLAGAAGRLRVVRIATSLRGERTREGIGVGSTTLELAQHYRGRADCVTIGYRRPDRGTWLVLRGPGPAMTAFALERAVVRPAPPKRPVVGEVMVQRAWLAGISGSCTGDWTRWRW